MERHFVKTSLGQVHVVEAGQGAGPPVVLMHQTPRSTDEFAEVISLVAMRHRVLAVDNPGYGCSDHPGEQPSVEQYCGIILEVLDHFGTERAHLVGHHTGAILAVEIAAARPERVEKIVLSGPVYMDEESRRELRKVFVQWHVQPDGSHLMEKWEKFSEWTEAPELVNRIVVDLLRAGETSEFGHFAIAEYHMESRLPRVQAPALLVFGANDPFGYSPKSRIFAETLPDCREVLLEGGVFLPAEIPEAFAQAVLDFL
jgi:pimeloyl-ACP methyl ester carboxylesterase